MFRSVPANQKYVALLKKHYQRQIIDNTRTDQELIRKLLTQLVNIMLAAQNDDVGLEKVDNFLKQLPIQEVGFFGDGPIQSLAEFLKIGKIKPLDTHVFVEEDLKYLKQLFLDFQDIYAKFKQEQKLKEENQWQFSYPLNANGEILTPKFLEWQIGISQSSAGKGPNAAFKDYKRSVQIDGITGDSFYPSIVILDSAPKTLDADTMAMVFENNKLTVYWLNEENQVSEQSIPENEIQAILTAITNLPAIGESLSNIQVGKIKADQDISTLSIIIDKVVDQKVDHHINQLVDQLKDTDENKILLKKWLKACGGQDINRFVDAAFSEQHFITEEYANLALNKPSIINWAVKDNKIIHIYQTEISAFSVVMDAYCRKDNQPVLIQVDPAVIQKGSKERDKLSPIMKIDAEISLAIENGKVQPKIVKFDIDCFASCLESGQRLLQSPEKNKNLMQVITPSSSSSMVFKNQ